MTDLIILAMLLDGPRHGYRLKRDAGMVMGQEDLHNNLIYPLLRTFTTKGWVTKKTVPGERGQKRQQYAITTLGQRTLLERLRDFSEQDARSAEAFRARVGFFELLPAGDRERILALREEALRSRDTKLDRLRQAMNLETYGNEVVAFLRDQIAAELSWIRRLRRMRPAEGRKKS